MANSLRLFSMLVGFGASLGLWRVFRTEKPDQALKRVLTGLWVLCGALVGGRIGYVLLHLNYFTIHPDLVPRFWLGGLNAFGALVGAVLFCVLAAIFLHQNLLRLLDAISLMLAPLGAAIWLGMWQEGIAYGKVLPAGSFSGILTPDESGVVAIRFPLQIAAGISLLAALLLLERMTAKSRSGMRFALSGSILSVHSALFSLLRADPVQPLWGNRIDTWLSVLFAVLFILFGIILMMTREKSVKIEKLGGLDDMQNLMIDLTINTDAVRKTLGNFIRTELARAGYSKLVLGLSGGVDSALACFLAVEAIGKENVLTMRMPYKTSSPESMTHAQLVIDALGVRSLTIPVTDMVEPLFAVNPGMDGLRKGNVMARERMIILFDQSAAFKGLVLGTGNKTEYLLGYTTLYGDSACGLNPLGDLFKTQVRQLSRVMAVPEVIIAKPPSADLWIGQTDEGELGFTYEDMDKLLFLLVYRGATPEECLANGFSRELVQGVIDQVRKSQFKRKMPPIAILSDQPNHFDFLNLPGWGA